MTREEREQAIAIFENEKKCVNRANKNDYCNRDCYNCELVKTDTEILTALDMAIKALEQEPSGDAVSRQAVLDLAKFDERKGLGTIIHALDVEQLPSVNPQEPKYCDRNICMENEYSDIGCEECEVTKSQTDAVSRQLLLKLMGEEPLNWTGSDKELQEVEDYRYFKNLVEQLPSVNPQISDQWHELKETITEMRDNDGTGTQQDVCKFLVNYMDVLEKQMQEPKTIQEKGE